MKRTTTHIIIESLNARTTLSWTGTEPDFTGISEPTLSILKAAWEEGKNNIQIISDPEPIPEIKNPDWDGLAISALSGDLLPVFTRLTSEAINSNAISLARNDINLAVTVLRNENALAASIKLLQQFEFVFSQEEKQLWNSTLQKLGFGLIALL